MDYDKQYSSHANLFGRNPEKILVTFHHKLNKECSVLDIGAGQGRNTLYLARHGFRVVAIDPSQVAIQTISAIAARKDLPVLVHQAGFDDFEPNTKVFGTVLIFGLVQILKRAEIDLLIRRIDQWTRPGSFAFITGFTTQDNNYSVCSKTGQNIGKNSFLNAENKVRTFLAENEILELFPAYDVIHHWEGLGEKHRHGNGPEEQHGMVEAVFRKK